ncbi:MAG: HesB/IscA family protein [bacterium]
MSAIDANPTSGNDVTLSDTAVAKMVELLAQVEENIEGVRVYATPGGCSGVSFGMTFTDQLADQDTVFEFGECKVIVDGGTLEYIRGVEIDFVESGDGDARFVFNNLQPVAGSGCGTCGSQGGGCG